MSVMKTFCGCMSTKSGSLTIIGFGILLYIGAIIMASMKLNEDSEGKGWFKDQVEVPDECKEAAGAMPAGESADTWWCKAITDMQTVERDAAIVKICVNSVLLVASLIGLYAAAMGKACLLLPHIILEFLQLVAFGALFATVVVVMGVYQPGGVDLSTTIAVGVLGLIFMVILFYLWLCVVSLYQTLKEIKNLGSDQVKIMGFQEDGQPYGKFETAEDYNPHSDDYPAGGADMDGPPSYRPPSSPMPPSKDAKLEDFVE